MRMHESSISQKHVPDTIHSVKKYYGIEPCGDQAVHTFSLGDWSLLECWLSLREPIRLRCGTAATLPEPDVLGLVPGCAKELPGLLAGRCSSGRGLQPAVLQVLHRVSVK